MSIQKLAETAAVSPMGLRIVCGLSKIISIPTFTLPKYDGTISMVRQRVSDLQQRVVLHLPMHTHIHR